MSAERQAKQRAPKWKRKHKNIPGYSHEAKTADELNMSVVGLRKWRERGVGPPYIKVGRQVYYSDASRAAWLKSREIHPVRELTAA